MSSAPLSRLSSTNSPLLLSHVKTISPQSKSKSKSKSAASAHGIVAAADLGFEKVGSPSSNNAVGDTLSKKKKSSGTHTKSRKSLPKKTLSYVFMSLENVLLPNDLLVNTPSHKDGVTCDLETSLRVSGCELIQICGRLLRLPQVALATAQILFQRYYYKKSFVFHKFVHVALGCVLLAAKIEETPRLCRAIINVYNYVSQKKAGIKDPIPFGMYSDEYITMKNDTIKSERRVLKELGFSVHIIHPHRLVINYLTVLTLHNNLELAQKCWSYMNDGLRTNIFQRFPPNIIATAVIYLAAKVMDISLPTTTSRPWWCLFDANVDDIDKISKTILCLYELPVVPWTDLDEEISKIRVEKEKERSKAVNKKIEIQPPPPPEVVVLGLDNKAKFDSGNGINSNNSNTEKENNVNDKSLDDLLAADPAFISKENRSDNRSIEKHQSLDKNSISTSITSSSSSSSSSSSRDRPRDRDRDRDRDKQYRSSTKTTGRANRDYTSHRGSGRDRDKDRSGREYHRDSNYNRRRR